jgi:hypothetical protein
MLFLRGLQLHGKSWKKISEIVTTRTVVQIRTHAQKYLIKLEKARKAGHQGVLMMDGKGVDNTERRGTSKVRRLKSNQKLSFFSLLMRLFMLEDLAVCCFTCKTLFFKYQKSSLSAEIVSFTSTSSESSVLEQKRQKNEPAAHLPGPAQHTTVRPLVPATRAAPSGCPPTAPAGFVPWMVGPYACVPPTYYNMQMMAHGYDFGAPLVSPSSQYRASFSNPLSAPVGNCQEQDLGLNAPQSVRMPLEAEMAAQIHYLGIDNEETIAQNQPNSYKRLRVPAGLAMATPAAVSTAHSSHRKVYVAPQQSCTSPSDMTPTLTASALHLPPQGSLCPFMTSNPLDELMQSLSQENLSSSSSSTSPSIAPEVDVPSMHDILIWDLNGKHSRPSSLSSWDEEGFDGVSTSSFPASIDNHVVCQPPDLSELQYAKAA